MAEKKSRAKTVKAEVGRKAIPGAVLRAAVQAEIDRRARRDLARAEKPMQRVVREMPTMPTDVMRRSLELIGKELGLFRREQFTPPEDAVNAIRAEIKRRQEEVKPTHSIERDVSATDVEGELRDSESGPMLLVSSCGCGCPSINITIARPHIAPLRPGSDELVSVAQLPPEAIPDLVKVLIGMAEERGVRCR